MKKTAVALAALLAVGSASAQSSVQIYGIVDSGYEYISKSAAPTAANPTATSHQQAIESGLRQSSRIGFRGAEDLGGGLRATFNLEGGIAVNTGAFTQGGLPFGRKSTVGLAGWLGDLQLGRRKDFTDEIAEPFSSITPFGVFILRPHANNMDRVGGNRANNMLYYSTPRWGGFRANATYGFGASPNSSSIGESRGFGAIYNVENFGIGAAYWTSKLGVVTASANSSSDQGAATGAGCNTVGLGSPGDTCIRTWIAGARYQAGPWHVHGTYSRVEQPLIKASAGAAPSFATKFVQATGTTPFTAGGTNNDRTAIVDLGAEYRTGPWNLKSSYIHSRYNFVGAAAKGTLNQYTLGVDYYLSKRTTLFATLAHLSASHMYSPGIVAGMPGADNSTSALGLGIRHTF